MSWDILLQRPLSCGAIVSQLFILPQIQYFMIAQTILGWIVTLFERSSRKVI
ncbi:hypothetical protein Dimus_039467 [Dionaea muscipula]